jgi:hypothetical protein
MFGQMKMSPDLDLNQKPPENRDCRKPMEVQCNVKCRQQRCSLHWGRNAWRLLPRISVIGDNTSCCSCRWGETMSLNCSHQRTYCSSPGDTWGLKLKVEWYWHGKTEELGENPVPVPLCPTQIPHGLTQARTRYCAVRGWRLTAWAMARPCYRVTDGTASVRRFKREEIKANNCHNTRLHHLQSYIREQEFPFSSILVLIKTHWTFN